MKHTGFFLFAALLAVIIGWLGWQIFTASSAHNALYDMPASLSIGSPAADLKIVEFFEYDCRPCQDAQEALHEAIRKDGNTLLFPRALGLDSAESIHAALLSYAAGTQGKFPQVHAALMRNYRVINEEVLNDMATTTGIDLEKLGKDMQDPAILALLEENSSLHQHLHLPQIPVFLVGKNIVYSPPEGVTAKDFLDVFAAARAEQE